MTEHLQKLLDRAIAEYGGATREELLIDLIVRDDQIARMRPVVVAADELDESLNEFGMDPAACSERAGYLNDALAMYHNGELR